ncbi:Neurochondrin-domain-containing protein [Tricharina praecox]|uniref:Neurochondrin-domain-containing protein n=1 Tax=Tricharina praecox TaxID=43433 RepID=UPI0022200D50|nr:Neurochondrin-domain-containing protein [Tricharina praecox]KAI5849043.1 Neurochondrin-domain-containing protein [Tricharina praecox]
MAETSSSAGTSETTQPQEQGEELISQCVSLLSKNDDTSRFVGLAMVLSISNHVVDPTSVFQRCAAALKPTFLDRLLKAGTTKQKSPEEATQMVELAVNIINAFATSLPDAGNNPFLVDRTPALIAVIPESSAMTVATILQILIVFASGSLGARKIVETEDFGPIVDALAANDNANLVLQHAFTSDLGEAELVRPCLKRLLSSLGNKVGVCERETRLAILSLLGELLTRVPSQFIPADPEWVEPFYAAFRAIFSSGPSSEERRHCIIIIASFLHSYAPSQFFQRFSTPTTDGPSSNTPPYLYLLLQIITIDIRASFPSLLAHLALPSYASTSQRLACNFDILSVFLNFLATASDFSQIGISPDHLLKLRTDISETFGLTLEFLRDRWDAVYTGAAYFEPGFEPADQPKQLTWDSTLLGGPERDALIIGAVRALAFWLREDESLREEAGGMVDVFLGLWTRGQEAGVDYRPWVVTALHGVMEEKHGREVFVQLRAWRTVWEDLRANCDDDLEGQLALEEARLLETFVQAEEFADEVWARELVAFVEETTASWGRDKLELAVVLFSLASECVLATLGPSGRFLQKEVEQLRTVYSRLVALVPPEYGDEVKELVETLENLMTILAVYR